jgi:hypothetical protein
MRSLDDTLQAARHCLVVLGDALPCRASVVHFFDASCHEFIVAVARGEQHKDMLLKRHKMSDPFLRVAKAHGGPFSWNELSGASLRSIGRYMALGSVSRVLACPVIVGARARWLATIELVDPLDDEPFDSASETAVACVARRLAEFVTIHGVMVEVAAIARFAHAGA